jgi:hypothetical protein
LKYQAAHPELAFWALLAFGAIDLVLGQLPNIRRRRIAFLLLTTLGVALVLAAVPFRYAGSPQAIIWLIGAEVLLAVGVLAREVHSRRLGIVAAFFAGGAIFHYHWDAAHDWHAGLLFMIAALCLWVSAEVLPRRWSALISSDFERVSLALLSYFAASLAAMAAWVTLPDEWIPVGWAALGIAALAVGVAWRVLRLRSHATLFSAVALLFVLGTRFSSSSLRLIGTAGGFPRIVLYTGALVALAAYVICNWAEIEEKIENSIVRPVITALATLLTAILLWGWLPSAWSAMGWLGLALLLAVAARRRRFADLMIEAHSLAAIALLRTVFVNLPLDALYAHNQLRVLTVGVAVACFYGLAWFAASSPWPRLNAVAKVHSWAGSLLLALLAWYELHPLNAVPAWMLLGLALFEVGLIRRSTNLRLQSYAALGGAFVRIWFVNLGTDVALTSWISMRVATVLPLALAFYYCYGRLEAANDPEVRFDRKIFAPEYCAWLGMLTIAALLRFELMPVWVITGWAVMALVLMAAAWRWKTNVDLYQAIACTIAVVVRGLLYNLAERSHFATQNEMLRNLLPPCALLLVSVRFALLLKKRFQEQPATAPRFLRAVFSRPEQFQFFLPVTLFTIALFFIVDRGGNLSVAWGLEAVLLFLLALAADQRSFRLTALGLLLVCVLKIVGYDVWRIGLRERYITLIVLGAALVLVSFLYNRNRERLRQFL